MSLYYLVAPFGAKSPPFTYKSRTAYEKGTLVEIPLREKVVLGVVLGSVQKPSFECKEIAEQKGYFDSRQVLLAEFVAYYYFCHLSEAYNLMQPHYGFGNSYLGNHCVSFVDFEGSQAIQPSSPPKSTKNSTSTTSNTRIVEKKSNFVIAGKNSHLTMERTLATKVALEKSKSSVDSHEASTNLHISHTPQLHPLSQAQKRALDFVLAKPISLLFGDTGSGKSEIYFHLIASALTQGKSALFLMPEISLTPQIESRLKNAFGEQVGIWHSKVGQKQKKEILQKLKSNELKIIAGARSALFLPIQNLGIIIIDEEHDDAYKSFQNPRYNARDCALYLSKKCGLKVVLGSATPSLTSYYLAKKGGYLYRLKGAFFEEAKKQYILENSPTSLTPLLLSHIKSTLQAKKQAIIFVPTRANFKALLCQECGYGFACPFCSVNMSLHIKQNRLICHYCGYSQITPKSCLECDSQNLTTKRIGTQQIADELKQSFSEAKIGIFDKDHITTSGKLNEALRAFRDGEIDILVGTQMLSKGHDYHNVELAVILGIEYVLNGGDFRSFERGIALLHQIAGRSGRKHIGKVFIQSPQAEFLRGFLGDYEEFLAWEEKRRSDNYPPFKKLVMIHCSHLRQERAKEQIEEILPILKRQKNIHIIGHGSNAIERIANKWRFHILLNGEKISDILEALNAVQNELESGVKSSVDLHAKSHSKPNPKSNPDSCPKSHANSSPQKWVESTQNPSSSSHKQNSHSQKSLHFGKRLDVDIDCLDTL